MVDTESPIATLVISGGVKGPPSERSEPVYGGYANGRGDVVLFARDVAYRVNFKNQILKEGPPLNVGARACYDAAELGEEFQYGNKTFLRLSGRQIAEICTAGQFRVGSRF